MNIPLIKKMLPPLCAMVLSFALLAAGKSISDSSSLITVFTILAVASLLWLFYTMMRLYKGWIRQEEKLLEDVKKYLYENYGSDFTISRVPKTDPDPKFPGCSIAGPLQIEGSLGNHRFRFRIIEAVSVRQMDGNIQKATLWEGYTLEWGVGYENKEYIKHKGIDDFDIRKIMEMIGYKIS